MNYLRNGFLLDIITLIPLNFLNLYRRRNVLFLIIKMLRIYKGFALFDVPRIMAVIKKGYQSKMSYIIKKHPKLANDADQDNNKIGEVLLISFYLRILKLVVVILNISFLTGLFWVLGCQMIQDFYYDYDSILAESNKALGVESYYDVSNTFL